MTCLASMADLGSARLCTTSACFTGAPLRHFEYTSANHLKFEQQTGRLSCLRRPRRSLLTAHAHKSSVNAVGEPATRPLRDNDQSVNVGTDARASEAAASSAAGQPVFVAPEDYQLLPGQMSSINRTLPLDQNDVFRCAGCTEPACQVWPSRCTASLLPPTDEATVCAVTADHVSAPWCSICNLHLRGKPTFSDNST